MASFPRKWSMRKIEFLREYRLRHVIELAGGGQVAPERLFDDDARMLGQFRGAEPCDHCLEERGRDGEVVRRTLGAAQRLLYRRKRALIIVVPVHIAELGQKMVECTPVTDPARSLYAVFHPFVQALRTPFREGDAKNGDSQTTSLRHSVEGREDHLVSEIAGYPEDHQRVRMGGGHKASPSWRRLFFHIRQTNNTRHGISSRSPGTTCPRRVISSFLVAAARRPGRPWWRRAPASLPMR